MQATLFGSGLNLMYYGMGVVFVFLTLLYLLTVLMSAIVQRFFTESALARAGEDHAMPPEHISVIAAAIRRYRHPPRPLNGSGHDG